MQAFVPHTLATHMLSGLLGRFKELMEAGLAKGEHFEIPLCAARLAFASSSCFCTGDRHPYGPVLGSTPTVHQPQGHITMNPAGTVRLGQSGGRPLGCPEKGAPPHCWQHPALLGSPFLSFKLHLSPSNAARRLETLGDRKEIK